VALLAVGLGIAALPASGVPKDNARPVPSAYLSHLSSSVQTRYYMEHPDQAPAEVRGRFIAANNALASAASTQNASPAARSEASGPIGDLFNQDDVGFPQNEESVTVCKNRPNIVEEGANDYRGLLDPEGNFTGWYFSNNGGNSVTKEGLLPALPAGDATLPSGGDPVSQSDDDCNIYMASLNYGPDPFNEGTNGIGVYKTTPEILESCPQGEDPDQLTQPECWPTGRIVAQADVVGGVGSFLDKEWLDVGQSGEAGNVVWVTYSDFAQDVNAPLGFTGAEIKAVRCDENLENCTEPILISGEDEDIQFSDVTIGESGRTMITWAEIEGELEETAQTFTVKMRIARPGSTQFGPTRIVSRETNPIPFGGFLHANDFRVATYPKSIMPMVNGEERQFVIWDRCRFRLLDTVCEESEIVMSYSDDVGRTWSEPETISQGGDNYFPAISDEVGNPNFAVAYFTNRLDDVFHNRQDVELVTIEAATGHVIRRQRVTPLSNESEADPLLGGFFIGDYIDVHLLKGIAYVGYNVNYRQISVLGEGFPIPQQDNYLTKTRS
jgi:hypothetical protein